MSASASKHVYDGDGVTTQWPYTFEIIDASDIQIYATDTLGVITKITTRYAVDTTLKKVTYPQNLEGQLPVLNPLAVGTKITLVRVAPLTQDVSLQNTGPLNADILEQAYDKLTMIAQQQAEALNRAVKYPVDQNPTEADTDTFLDTIIAAKTVAQSAADAALASENASANNASAALISENNSEDSAIASAASAQSAADSLAALGLHEQNAAASALAAANSANTATEQASISTTKAGIATTKANEASASASSASTSASTATTKANEASASAAAAAISEGHALASESAAAASAATALAATGFTFYGKNITWTNEASIDVDVSGFSTDARNALWQLCDIANDYERMFVSIKAISATVVRISADPALPAGSYRLMAPKSLINSSYSSDSSWSGETTKDINVSGSISDARLAMWQVLDNANDFERMMISIKTPSASIVRISTDFPLTGSFRLVGAL